MSLFIYGIELWGGTYNKYINQIEKFISRAYQNGYMWKKLTLVKLSQRQKLKLWTKIINNALQELLPN